jgi:DNA-binding response OmpR family regulator
VAPESGEVVVEESHDRVEEALAEGSGRALVIEDHAPLQGVLELLLRQRGLYATFATDGHAALDAIARQVFDVIFLDLRLPGYGDGAPQGMDVLQTLRALGVTTSVIVMSGYLDEETRCAAVEGGALVTLQKPLALAEVGRWVDRALEESSRSRQTHLRRAADLVIDLSQMRAMREGDPVPMSAREFRLLLLLTE